MDWIFAATVISFAGVIIYYYIKKKYGYWKKLGIPYLKDILPGLGNVYPMLLMKKNVLSMYQEFYEQMPGCSMVGFYNLTDPSLLIRDPEVIKSVLQTNFSSFSTNALSIDPEIDRLLAGNPFFLPGEKWKASRKQLTSAFTSGKLKYMYESISAVCDKLVRYLDDEIAAENGEVEAELKELFSRYTAEVVASAAFGVEGRSFEDDGSSVFTKIGKIMFEPSYVKGMKQLAVMFVPVLGRMMNAAFIPPKSQQVFLNLIRDVLKYREEENVQRNDFLQLMIGMKKSGALDFGYHAGQFNEESIASHATSFFFDGYETSSIALSFIGYLLASHPEIQQRVRDEVLTLLEKHDGIITYEALQEMTYMDQVMYESMRLYPSLGFLSKICTNEIDLEGSDGIACRVTPGTNVVIPVGGLHMDPRYWPEPETFDPERFSDENKQNRHRFVYLSFGEGPRICIGMRMAMLQMKAAIATTLKRYTLELSPKTKEPIKLDPRYFLTAAVGGIWVKLRPL